MRCSVSAGYGGRWWAAAVDSRRFFFLLMEMTVLLTQKFFLVFFDVIEVFPCIFVGVRGGKRSPRILPDTSAGIRWTWLEEVDGDDSYQGRERTFRAFPYGDPFLTRSAIRKCRCGAFLGGVPGASFWKPQSGEKTSIDPLSALTPLFIASTW